MTQLPTKDRAKRQHLLGQRRAHSLKDQLDHLYGCVAVCSLGFVYTGFQLFKLATQSLKNVKKNQLKNNNKPEGNFIFV